MIRCLIGICLALSAGGCISYAARVDQSVRRGDVEIAVERVEISVERPRFGHRGGAISLSITDAPPDVVLLRAWVGERGTLCEGRIATVLSRSGGRSAHAPLQVGERISLAVDDVEVFINDAPQLHLQVMGPDERARCVSFPMAPHDEPLAWRPGKHWTLGIDFGLEIFMQPLGSVRQVMMVPVSLGLWIDRFHFRAGVGVGGAGCHETDCLVESSDRYDGYPFRAGPVVHNWSWIFPVTAGVDYFMIESRRGGQLP